MPSVDAPLRTRSLPYALPPDALEGLLRLAAHVALTETAVLFLQRGSNYWVLSTSGVSATDAHMAALLLPDVLGPEANDYLCLDATAGTEAAGLLASAMAKRPGFLFLHRFVVDGEDCYAILALAHPVAKPLPSEETASLLSEISRQIALRIEARAEKRELEASRERRALRDRFLVAICRENAIGQCLLDSAGKILSLSDGLVQVLEIDRREVEFQPFEQIFAFASAFRDEQTGIAGEAAEPARIPWERVFDTACLFRRNANELLRLEATAAPARLIDGTDGWCVAISGGEARELALLPAPRRLQKILIAEDHPVNQRVIQGMVEKLGLSADVVSNGLEAVHAACHGSYAAILMDCQMPDMDGIEATRFIRGTEDRIGRVPIVAVTAFGHEEDRARCFEAGVDEFMVKPIRIEALAQVLAQWAPVAMKPESPASPAAPDPRDHTRRDLEQAINRLSADLDAELVHEVVALFLEDTRVRIDEIRKLSTTVERSQLRNAAHRIKGSCGSLGAVTLMNACERLENLAQNGSREEVEATIDQVAELFDGIVPLLREFLDASGVRAMDAPPPTDEG